MKKLLVTLTLILAAGTANAKALEFGFGDYYTYRYEGTDYSAMLMLTNGTWKNAYLVGRGVHFDALYLGMVVGLTDSNKSGSGTLDFATGVEAFFTFPFGPESNWTAKIESVQTPKFQADTILFGYRF